MFTLASGLVICIGNVCLLKKGEGLRGSRRFKRGAEGLRGEQKV